MTNTNAKILPVAKIKANIALVATNAAAWNNLVQETAVATLYHAQTHGDCTLAQALVFAIPATEKRTQVRSQLIAWYLAYSPVMVKNDPDWPGKLVKSGKVAERGFLIDLASENPWYLHGDKKTEDKKTLTLAELIASYRGFANKINKAIEDKTIEGNDILAARMFAAFVKTNDLPDFKIEAYLEKERLEREATALARLQAEQSGQDNKPEPEPVNVVPEMIEPVSGPAQEQPVTAQAANG